MSTKFAEKAKAIIATYGEDSGTTRKLLKELNDKQKKYLETQFPDGGMIKDVPATAKGLPTNEFIKLHGNTGPNLTAHQKTYIDESMARDETNESTAYKQWQDQMLKLHAQKAATGFTDTTKYPQAPPRFGATPGRTTQPETMFASGGRINIDREIENGIEVEKEHAPTLKFLKKYLESHGKLPTLNKLAKSIATDHEIDFKKLSDNPQQSYYQRLIENDLSDEKSEYASGGSLKPVNMTDAQLNAIRMMADGGILNELKSGGGIHIAPSKRGTFTAQATKMGMGIQAAASKILNAPEGRYSPAMRKKANFAKNFAHAYGGDLTHLNKAEWQEMGSGELQKFYESRSNYNDHAEGGQLPLWRMISGANIADGGMPLNIHNPLQVDNQATPQFGGALLPSVKSNIPVNTNPVSQKSYFDVPSYLNANKMGVSDFAKTNNFSGFGQKGFSIGSGGVPFQKINQQTGFAGGVTGQMLFDANPALYKETYGDRDPSTLKKEDASLFHDTLMKHPEYVKRLQSDPSNPTYGMVGADHLRAVTNVAPETIAPMQSRGVPLEVPKTPNTLAPVVAPVVAPSVPQSQFDPNLLPILAGAMPTRKPAELDASLNLPRVNAQQFSPDLLSTAPVIEQLNTQYTTGAGQLAGATGGSASALRSNLQGLNRGTGRSAGEALTDIYGKNIGMKNAAEQFNLENVNRANEFNAKQGTTEALSGKETDMANLELMQGWKQRNEGKFVGAMQNMLEMNKAKADRDMVMTVSGYDPVTGKKIGAPEAPTTGTKQRKPTAAELLEYRRRKKMPVIKTPTGVKSSGRPE